MSVPLAQANANLLADIKTNFIDTYQVKPSGLLEGVLASVESIGMERRQDRFFYYKTIPLVERIQYNEEVSFGGLEQESYVLDALKFGKALAWSEDDEKDDLTRSLPNQARKLGDGLKNLPVRIFFQILQDASDTKLLGSTVPSAPDGAALYSSSTRFGDASGNIVTATGTTAAAITDDFFSAMTRFSKFVHTDGETPLVPEGDQEEVVIFYPPEMRQGFAEAFIRTQVANASSAFEGSNVIMESGFKIKLFATRYLTDVADWYIFLPRATVKPIVFGQREGLVTREFNSSNSAGQAKKFESFFMAWERQGWTPNLPYGTIKVA